MRVKESHSTIKPILIRLLKKPLSFFYTFSRQIQRSNKPKRHATIGLTPQNKSNQFTGRKNIFFPSHDISVQRKMKLYIVGKERSDIQPNRIRRLNKPPFATLLVPFLLHGLPSF